MQNSDGSHGQTTGQYSLYTLMIYCTATTYVRVHVEVHEVDNPVVGDLDLLSRVLTVVRRR